MSGKMPDSAIPDHYALARPCVQAAGLAFAALRALGEYPADSPDYDPVAVDHLRRALERLAPGLGNMEFLGAPHPATRPPVASQRPARDDETQQAPVAAARVR